MDDLEYMAIFYYDLYCFHSQFNLNSFLYVAEIMHVLYKKEKKQKKLFQELPFYNALIEKPHIKHLNTIDLLHELPFYDEFSIVKISQAFERYARNYRIEIIDL